MGRGGLAFILEAAAEALLGHLEACSRLHLSCIDPPLFTTGYLEALGYTGYRLRRVLQEARQARPIEVYVSSTTRFALEPVYSIGEAHYLRGERLPVDPDDCLRIPGGCSTAPHTSVFRVYLHGRHGGEELRVNVVYLGVLADRATGGAARRVLGEIAHCLRGEPIRVEEARSLMERVLGLAERALPLVAGDEPGGREWIIARSPGLRRLLGLLRSRCLQ